MITGDLYFTFIKIPSNYKCLLVCKSWHKNIIGDIKKRKIEFYDMQLYNAINNKHIFLLYRAYDKVLLQAYDNVIAATIATQNIKYTSDDDNIEKYIADEYANILSKYYNYNIILT